MARPVLVARFGARAGARAVALALALAGCPAPSSGGDDGGLPGAPDLAGAPVPDVVCDARAYGAVGDGKALDTRALQAAIDACAARGGGRVTLRDGRFLSGTIALRSRVTLDIGASATLLGSQRGADYPDQSPPISNTQLSNCRKALVYAEGASDVSIEGGGTIDGNARGVADWNGNKIKEALRPMAVFTVTSQRVRMRDVTVRDAGTWAVVHMEVSGLTVQRLTVRSDLGATHDGIDVVDGHNVLIEDSVFESGDDSICLKSGSARGTEHVIVRRCQTVQSGVANGVKFGTASVGSFKDILVEDVSVANAQAAALAVESVDGAAIAGVTFRRIDVRNVGTPFFVLLGSRDRDPTRVGSIDDLRFESVRGGELRYGWGSIVTGSVVGDRTFALGRVSFSDVDLAFRGAGVPANPAPFTVDSFPEYQGPVSGQPGQRYNQYPDAKFITGTGGVENTRYYAPGYGLFLRHAGAVTLDRCRAGLVGADPRPAVARKDVAAVQGSCTP